LLATEAIVTEEEIVRRRKEKQARRRVAEQLNLYFAHLNIESDPAALLLRVEQLLRKEATPTPSPPAQNP
jgi:hypothetical protein